MHELGITRNIVAICAENAGGRRVSRITVEVGKLSAVVPRALEFCFDVAAAGTPVEGARLEIVEIDGRGRCKKCGQEAPLSSMVFRCAGECGGAIEVLAGEELNIKEMETV
jgi:hydrogenase nickel incorporation protein HypA/HybF